MYDPETHTAPRNWRYPVPLRLSLLPEGERVAEACRLASGGMPALQAAASCGLTWASDLLDAAVALGHAGCLVRLHAVKKCAVEAYRFYDGLAWRDTGDADARVPRLPADWAQRAGHPLTPRWGWLGLIYAYEAAPLVMAPARTALLDAGDEVHGATAGVARDVLEAQGWGDDDDAAERPRVLIHTPISLQDLRKRPAPEADLLPGLARARGFAVVDHDCAGPQFGFEPTGVRPPLVERGHEAQVARAAAKDRATTTRHDKVAKAARWHRERLEAIQALVEPEPLPDDHQPDEDRAGYPFWDGYRKNLAGPLTDSLYEQHVPKTLPDREPSVYLRDDPLVARQDMVAKPTPLALWWAFACPDSDPLHDHGSAVRCLLLENAHYWDLEPLHLGELKALIRRQARAEGVPDWPTPEEVTKAANRADCYAEDFDGVAYARWATAVITEYAREQLAGVPYPDEALDHLWYVGTRGNRLYEWERTRAHNALAVDDVERPLLQFLFTPEPGAGKPLLIKGDEPWAQRPTRTKLPAVNGPAEERGEEAALNQLDQFAAAVRAGELGEAPKRLLAFAGTLRNFLEGALGNATMPGRGTVKWLRQDGESLQLLDLVRAEAWRDWQETRRPERKIFGPDPYIVKLYAYLADPRTLYTELAPALLWVHQVCFAQITGGRFRLYVSKAELGRSRHRNFVTEAQVAELLSAGALGNVTDQAFRVYDTDGAPADWVRRDWTPARLRALARSAYAVARAARDGVPVGPDVFRALAEAMGYPESAVARGLARVGAGIPVASVAGFGHLDADYRAQEQGLDPAHRRGLLGNAWSPKATFREVVDGLAGYVAPQPTTAVPLLEGDGRDPETLQ